jgi:hypothetical protein
MKKSKYEIGDKVYCLTGNENKKLILGIIIGVKYYSYENLIYYIINEIDVMELSQVELGHNRYLHFKEVYQIEFHIKEYEILFKATKVLDIENIKINKLINNYKTKKEEVLKELKEKLINEIKEELKNEK